MIKFLNKRKKNNRKENLIYILKSLDGVIQSGNDVKVFHFKHNTLINTCMELTQGLPLDERKIVQAIIEKCRY